MHDNYSPLFKGGFAKCYELKDLVTGEITAGKIVPKSLLVKAHQREKMAQEISLHKTLNHQYIVKLFSFFEDKVLFVGNKSCLIRIF